MEGKRLLKAAIEYGISGWKIFFVNGNSPITKDLVDQATDNPETIIRRWVENPNADIYLATGNISDVVILKVHDTFQQLGLESACRLQVRDGKFRTRKHISPKKVIQLFYKYPRGFSAIESIREIPGYPGIELLADDSYVILPPSQGYVSANYKYISESPDWLISIIRKHSKLHRDSSGNNISKYNTHIDRCKNTIPKIVIGSDIDSVFAARDEAGGRVNLDPYV